MSAIAGILYFDGSRATTDLINGLNVALKHRGPDEQNTWTHGPVALGHCMLRTTPESIHERQPLESHDGNIVLVWDGRLDNRPELKRELRRAGATLQDDSDAGLVLQSYLCWGDTCPNHLLGDFVCAVWDNQKNNLLCFRDPVGCRPLYFTKQLNFFAFASEEEALTQLPGVSTTPNKDLIAYMLEPSYTWFDNSKGWLWETECLAPGTKLRVTLDGQTTESCYWRLETSEFLKFNSDLECQEAFRSVFGQAVKDRLRSNSAVSGMISGGLDSAGIIGAVKRETPEIWQEHFHSYSTVHDSPANCIESQCIYSMVEDLKHRAHFVKVPSITGACDMEDLVSTAWDSTHPVDNWLLLPALMCLAASKDGHRIMLHGASGDLTTSTPLNYHTFFIKQGDYRQAWQECKKWRNNTHWRRYPSASRLMVRSMLAAFTPEFAKSLYRKVRIAKPARNNLKLIDPKFEDLIIGNRLSALQNRKIPPSNLQNLFAKTTIGAVHGIGSSQTGFGRVAARFGIELRDPWADRRVVEFFHKLPLMYKVRNGWTKHLVRTSYAQEIPLMVRHRLGKEHLGWHYVDRLMAVDHELVWDDVAAHAELIRRYVNWASAQQLNSLYTQQPSGANTDRLYSLFVLYRWLKRYTPM